MRGRSIQEIAVGDTAELTRVAAPGDVAQFIDSVGDHNPIHQDHAYAASTRFEKPIVPGMWTASLISTVLGTQLPGPGCVYVSLQISFTRPVYFGDRVTARVEVVERLPDRNRVRLRAVCTNQEQQEVLIGETVLSPSKTAVVYTRREAGSTPGRPLGPAADPVGRASRQRLDPSGRRLGGDLARETPPAGLEDTVNRTGRRNRTPGRSRRGRDRVYMGTMRSEKQRMLRGRLVYISVLVLVRSLRVVLFLPLSFLWFGLHGRFPPQRERPPRPLRVFQRNARTLAYIAGATEITPAHLRRALDAGGEILPPCGFRAIPFSPEAGRLWSRAIDAAGGWNAAAIDHLRTALASD